MRTIVIISLMMLFTGIVKAQKGQDTVKIKTSALCGMCEERIEHDMKFEKGVYSADLNLDTKVLTVVYKSKKTNPDKLRKAVTMIGYAADDMPANKKAFAKLPGCCQKEGACSHDH